MIKKIAVLTSGGDAPGMNACIRAVARTAIANNIEIYGISQGYYGLYHDKIEKLSSLDVAGIIDSGGTFLKSARFPEFKEIEIREKAIQNLDKHGIEALVVIGGDGSYMGAKKLSEMGYPCIGVPGTIDNDAPGTDFTIGFDTALNTIVEAVDRLRDTSSSHARCSVVEVMGRDAGDLALDAGIACGAEFTLVPEIEYNVDEIISMLKASKEKGKNQFIIMVAEGLKIVPELSKRIENETGIETRATILGHIQRGGRPSARDRVLASEMGSYAVSLLLKGESARCVGIMNHTLINTDIIQAMETVHDVEHEKYSLANKYLNV